MPDKKIRGYWCDKCYERIAAVRGRPQCENYRKSELQTWCGMGRLPEDCRVETMILRGEKPESYDDWLKNTIRASKHAERQIQGIVGYLNSKKVRDAIKRVCEVHARMDERGARA